MSAPRQSELLGRFSFEASAAIIMDEQPVLSFADVTGACNSNNLNFSGFSLITFNMLNEVEVGNKSNLCASWDD